MVVSASSDTLAHWTPLPHRRSFPAIWACLSVVLPKRGVGVYPQPCGALAANALAHQFRGKVLTGEKEMDNHGARVFPSSPGCLSAHTGETTEVKGFPSLV